MRSGGVEVGILLEGQGPGFKSVGLPFYELPLEERLLPQKSYCYCHRRVMTGSRVRIAKDHFKRGFFRKAERERILLVQE